MRVIKKYPNRRLYDTEKSRYVTIVDVLKIIRDEKVDLQVVDAESGEDITRGVLIQIILDQENGDKPIFTTPMLTRFIRVYDDAAQSFFEEILDKNLSMFSEQQKKVQEQVEDMVTQPVQFVRDIAERTFNMWAEAQKKYFFLPMGLGGEKEDKDPEKKD